MLVVQTGARIADQAVILTAFLIALKWQVSLRRNCKNNGE
ncbi:hypothetical protein SAMN05444673_4005 [Bacillus sp. OV166]|nr:hypothetical protein SAMN05444673_4005 [Bacillus sp. OV166]